MKKLRSTYVRRGDVIRRRNKIRRSIAFVTVVSMAVLVIANRRPSPATAEAASVSGGTSFSFGLLGENRRLRRELENATGEANLLRAQIERNNKVFSYSTRYNIPASLANVIFDVFSHAGKGDVDRRRVAFAEKDDELVVDIDAQIGPLLTLELWRQFLHKGKMVLL